MLVRMVLRRVLELIPVLVGLSFITFAVLNLLPGNVTEAILGSQATAASERVLSRQLGLNHPFLVRYWDWVTGVLHGNLGNSLITNESVTSQLGQRLPVSAELVVLSILIALLIAIPLAVLASRRAGGIVDRFSSLLAMIGLSVPGFVIGLALILLVSVQVKLFPATGFTPLSQGLLPNLRTMFLPSLSLSFVLMATYTRVLRADMAEQLTSAEYVTAARARGIRSWTMLIRHVLRNSIFGLITVVGLNLGTLFGATVIIETVFALPGLGSLLISSITSKDSPVVQGVVLVMALAVVIANLLTDILYSVLDPRIRYGNTSR